MGQWITTDGQARLDVAPSGNANDNATLRTFARDVQNVEPNATEGPISILEARRTIITAFLEAGAWALLSIAVLLWITLRRLGDVLLTLIPLLVAGVVTLEICVVIDMPLNFANIIALPLLLGVGVAFKIYYIMAWREGQTRLLQSVLTRAVTFSACTTATAFGSLYFSSDPGTSSMGKLLAISLLTTMTAAAFFQPVLMGKPREKEPRKHQQEPGGRSAGSERGLSVVDLKFLDPTANSRRNFKSKNHTRIINLLVSLVSEVRIRFDKHSNFGIGTLVLLHRATRLAGRRRVGIKARIDLVVGRFRQARPILVLSQE